MKKFDSVIKYSKTFPINYKHRDPISFAGRDSEADSRTCFAPDDCRVRCGFPVIPETGVEIGS